MKYKFKQRIPGGVDPTTEPYSFEFDDLYELESHIGIQRSRIYGGETLPIFVDGRCLMIQNKEKSFHWVLGYIDGNEGNSLKLQHIIYKK